MKNYCTTVPFHDAQQDWLQTSHTLSVFQIQKECMTSVLKSSTKGAQRNLTIEISLAFQSTDGTVPYTQACGIAHKICSVKITLVDKPCRFGNMQTALRAIAQTKALLESNHHNPCLQPKGKLIFVLKCQFQSNKKGDLPPTHIEPLPIKLIQQAVKLAMHPIQKKITEQPT